MGTGREMKVAMVSGKADVILTSETNFPVLLGEGFDATAVGSLGSAGRIGLLVKNEKYRNLSDLKGKTIATIFGTSIHEPAVKWANEAGAKLLGMGSVAAMQAALESGDVDAIVSWDPYLTASLKERSWRMLRDSDFNLITVATTKFAQEHPDTLRKFNEALKESVIYLRQNRAALDRKFAAMSKIDPEVIHQASMSNANYARDTGGVDMSITPAFVDRLKTSSEFLFKEKIVKLEPQPEHHVWEARVLNKQ